MLSLDFHSAHRNKTQPIALGEFTQRSFPANITAYNTPWTGKPQEMPVLSHEELGVTKKSFKALKIILPYLDTVFRAIFPGVMPEKHSTVANHVNGLMNLADEVFSNRARQSRDISLHQNFKDLENKTRLSIILHDLAEIPGEISSFHQRLAEPNDKGLPTEDDRKTLEKRVAKLLIFEALKAAYKGNSRLDDDLNSAILDCQSKVKACSDSAVKRYEIVDEFLSQFEVNYNSADLDAEFLKDFTQLQSALAMTEEKHEAGSEQELLKSFFKILDKLDSKFHVVTVGDFSNYDFKRAGFVQKEYEADKKTLLAMKQHPLLKAFVPKLVELFNTLKKICMEWPVLSEVYKNFNWNEIVDN